MGQTWINPLMNAIERVLEDLGDPAGLEPPLRNSARSLAKEYSEMSKCCCHDGVVVGPMPPPRGRRPSSRRSTARQSSRKRS